MLKRTLLFLLLFSMLFPFQSSTAVDALINYEQITAHRGSSGSAPENTLSAVMQAADHGAGYAEIDVQLSADGVIILYHDQTLMKLGIKRNVTDMRYDELQDLDVGSHFSPRYAGETIPALDHVMKAAHQKIKLNIELKMFESTSPLPEMIVRLIEMNGFENRCIVTSFDASAIKRVKALNPSIKTGLIVSSEKALTKKVWSGDFEILSVKSRMINRSFVKMASQYKKEIHVWTVNKEKEMKRVLRFDVSSIITDYPEILYQIVKYR